MSNSDIFNSPIVDAFGIAQQIGFMPDAASPQAMAWCLRAPGEPSVDPEFHVVFWTQDHEVELTYDGNPAHDRILDQISGWCVRADIRTMANLANECGPQESPALADFVPRKRHAPGGLRLPLVVVKMQRGTLVSACSEIPARVVVLDLDGDISGSAGLVDNAEQYAPCGTVYDAELNSSVVRDFAAELDIPMEEVVQSTPFDEDEY